LIDDDHVFPQRRSSGTLDTHLKSGSSWGAAPPVRSREIPRSCMRRRVCSSVERGMSTV
jgi:hypothetical protein